MRSKTSFLPLIRPGLVIWIFKTASCVHFKANFDRRHEGYPMARPLLGIFSKSRRRRQRGHGKTKDLMGKTMVQLVCFQLCTFFSRLLQKTTWNHQNFRRLRMETTTANYFNFYLKLNAAQRRYTEVEMWRRKRR